MKCDRCGVESEVEQAFTVKKKWAGLLSERWCPKCVRANESREQLTAVILVALGLIALDALTYQRGPVRVLLDLGFLVAVNIPIVVAHELAHVVAGTLLGVRVFRVMFGSGRRLASGRAFGITWEWRLWPFSGGTVMACPPQRGNRARFFGAVLAGPLLHAFLLLAAAVLQFFLLILQGGFGMNVELLLHWTGLFMTFDLIILLFNLLPRRAKGSSGQIGTDGWQLLHLLFMKPEEESVRAQGFFIAGSMEALLRKEADEALHWIDQGLARYPRQPALQAVQGEALIKKKRFAEARDLFVELLSTKGAQDPLYKYLMYNNIAYVDVLLGDPELLPEADRFSAEARRQLPWEPSITGTRGTVLLALDRLDEGMALLKQALAEQKTNHAKAEDAYHLAAGEERRGNAEAARRYRELARKYEPNLFLLQGDGGES
jgi:tetratricopeptide (TPR) repeat protein